MEPLLAAEPLSNGVQIGLRVPVLLLCLAGIVVLLILIRRLGTLPALLGAAGILLIGADQAVNVAWVLHISSLAESGDFSADDITSLANTYAIADAIIITLGVALLLAALITRPAPPPRPPPPPMRSPPASRRQASPSRGSPSPASPSPVTRRPSPATLRSSPARPAIRPRSLVRRSPATRRSSPAHPAIRPGSLATRRPSPAITRPSLTRHSPAIRRPSPVRRSPDISLLNLATRHSPTTRGRRSSSPSPRGPSRRPRRRHLPVIRSPPRPPLPVIRSRRRRHQPATSSPPPLVTHSPHRRPR